MGLRARPGLGRGALRGFLAARRRVLPAAMMPDGVEDPAELEELLDYLEVFR